MICSVTLYHHRPYYRNGDKESETIIKSVTKFNTKKEANSFINSEIKQKYDNCTLKKKENSFYIYTGKHWTNEGTEEDEEEIYIYRIE